MTGQERSAISGPFLSAFRRAATAEPYRSRHEPPRVSPQCAVFDDFLPIAQLNEIGAYALAKESSFVASGVVRQGAPDGAIDTRHRRSRLLADLGPLRAAFLSRLLTALPTVLVRLGMQAFRVVAVDTQVTATNDGEFFRRHTDSGHAFLRRRQVSFTYFFHREPRAFAGGELCLYDSWSPRNGPVPDSGVARIVPRRNSIVFFPSGVLHEIAAVSVPSRLFRDSRFTVNGWMYR